MAKIAINKDGVMYAIFRIEDKDSKRRFAGNIYYSISTDNGKSWSERKKLVMDKESKSQSFFDVAILSDGELGLSWLDSRKLEEEKDGSTLYFAKSKGDQGFINEKPVAGSTCQCCRTDIFVDFEGKINIAFRNLNDESIRDMYRVISKDNGEFFGEPALFIPYWRRSASVVSTGFCRLLVLSRRDYLRLAKKDPEIETVVREAVEAQLHTRFPVIPDIGQRELPG